MVRLRSGFVFMSIFGLGLVVLMIWLFGIIIGRVVV